MRREREEKLSDKCTEDIPHLYIVVTRGTSFHQVICCTFDSALECLKSEINRGMSSGFIIKEQRGCNKEHKDLRICTYDKGSGIVINRENTLIL